MAKTICNECGKRYSSSDYSCPRCGASNFDALVGKDEPVGLNDSGALITCKDCGKRISRRADSCPSCGGSTKAFTQKFGRVRKQNWGYEWKSETTIFGFPLIHIAVGRKNGMLRVAKGVIAIGQFAIGLITLAQFGIGFLFGFGQFMIGFAVVGQFAGGVLFGLGQFASGYVAIGQMAIGYYVLAQQGFGFFSWTSGGKDPEAVLFFNQLAQWLGFK